MHLTDAEFASGNLGLQTDRVIIHKIDKRFVVIFAFEFIFWLKIANNRLQSLDIVANDQLIAYLTLLI